MTAIFGDGYRRVPLHSYGTILPRRSSSLFKGFLSRLVFIYLFSLFLFSHIYLVTNQRSTRIHDIFPAISLFGANRNDLCLTVLHRELNFTPDAKSIKFSCSKLSSHSQFLSSRTFYEQKLRFADFCPLWPISPSSDFCCIIFHEMLATLGKLRSFLHYAISLFNAMPHFAAATMRRIRRIRLGFFLGGGGYFEFVNRPWAETYS